MSEAKTMPAKFHRFENRTAAFKLQALASKSLAGSFPAFVMNMTGYVCCLVARRMHISGVNEESMIFRLPA
jgi:hypothetical protein